MQTIDGSVFYRFSIVILLVSFKTLRLIPKYMT